MKTIFSDIRSEEKVDKITKNIKTLESYANDNHINTQLLLNLLFQNRTSANIQKVLCLGRDELAEHLKNNLFKRATNDLRYELKIVLENKRRFKDQISEYNTNQESLKNSDK